MSSVTASVLVGPNHPNDNGICPTHLALLHEGSRAAWVLHHLPDPRWPLQMPVIAPETVVDDLFDLIVREVLPTYGAVPRAAGDECDVAGLEVPGLALAVTTFDRSLLHSHLGRLRSLRVTEVTLADQTWQRYRSSWTGEWVVSGCL